VTLKSDQSKVYEVCSDQSKVYEVCSTMDLRWIDYSY